MDTIFQILASPWTAAVGAAVAAWGLSLMIKSSPQAHEAAEATADYLAAVEWAVHKAEALGMDLPGQAKLGIAIDEMQDWLAEQGIEGDAAAVTLQRVRSDVEIVRARLFPSGGA
jgi:hypothetical protein